MRRVLAAAAGAAVLSALSWCPLAGAAAYNGFSDPQAVNIEDYAGSAMEPFISPDGDYLLFNTSNVAPSIPSLQYATRVDAHDFDYQGQILGEAVNEPGVLSGTPTIDREGDLYFVSPRSYPQTLSTVYGGRFSGGELTGVHLVPGVSGGTPGTVDFDVSVSPDGRTLYVSVGLFNGGAAPASAHLAMYDRMGAGFVPDPHGGHLLHNVNKSGELDYAASVSTSGLELFFTRADPARGTPPAIYRAVRRSITRPFGHPQQIAAITGFAEAPSISSDGTTLYYHRLVGGQFQIETVTRP
jgi:hypothetical protein